jgi:ClpP class serine protease
VLDIKPIGEIDDQTVILADVAAKALNQVRITVKNLLKKHMDEDQAEKTAVTLTQGTWTHDYPIDVDQIAALGLNVSTEMPSEIYSLMGMYPQPRTARPSVEYSPGPVYPSGPKE